MLKDILYALGLYKLRWDQAFPNAKEGDEPTPGIRRVAEQGRCQVCGRLTSWRNTVADAWVCSLRCWMKGLRELQRKPGRMLEEFVRRTEKQQPLRQEWRERTTWIVPLLTAMTGPVGAVTGLVSIWKRWRTKHEGWETAMAWGFLGRLVGIHNAARMGNVGMVRGLLRKNPSLVNARDETGNTPLHCAIGYFELGVVEELLAHGADVNAQDNNGVTPLHILAAGVPPNPPPPPKSVQVTAGGLQGIHLKIAELLLAHHADLHARTAWGWTPLETAERANTRYMVELLRQYETKGRA